MIHHRVIIVVYLDRDSIEFPTTQNVSSAIMGGSNNPSRPSKGVMSFRNDLGDAVIPINSNEETALSKKCGPSQTVANLDHGIDAVDIFRKPCEAQDGVWEAPAINAHAIWFQLGVVNLETASIADEAGHMVAMDTCPKIEIPEFGSSSIPWDN